METTILILSITLLVLVAANLMLLVADLRLKNLIKSLRDKISDLEKKVVNHDLIIPGEKITFKTGLVFGKTTEFSVIYEAIVTEVTDKQVKVQPYGITSEHNLPAKVLKSPNYKQDILDFMMGKWVDRKDIAIILSADDIRNRKLNDILS